MFKRWFLTTVVTSLFIGLLSSGVMAQAGAGKKIGVLWVKNSGMAQRVLDGMQAKLKEIAPGIEVEVIKEIASDDEAKPIYEKWQTEKDGIVFLRSEGGTFMKNNPPKIPAFIGACNNPEKLGLMANMKKPDGKITGVSYYLPAEMKMKLFTKVLPNVKSVALLVQKGHPSTPIEQAEVKAYCDANGLTYNEAVCENVDGLKAEVAKLKESVGLFILGNQALLIDNGAAVLETAGNIPIVSLTEKPVENKTALIGMAADDVKLGGILAQSVVSVIVDGKPVSEVPVVIDEQPKILLCVDLMTKWSVKPPMDILKIAKQVK